MTLKSILCVLWLLSSLNHMVAIRRIYVTDPVSTPYELYQMVYLSPKAYSTNKNPPCYTTLAHLPNTFTTHGLWRANNTDVITCTARPYVKISAGDLLEQEMLTRWPNLNTGSAEPVLQVFWQHEWDVYGSCTIFDQRQYFLETLKLHKLINVTDIFSRAGISPGFSGDLTAYENVLAPSTMGKTPDMMCNNRGGGKTCDLMEIKICYELDLITFRDCPLLMNDPSKPNPRQRSKSCLDCRNLVGKLITYVG